MYVMQNIVHIIGVHFGIRPFTLYSLVDKDFINNVRHTDGRNIEIIKIIPGFYFQIRGY